VGGVCVVAAASLTLLSACSSGSGQASSPDTRQAARAATQSPSMSASPSPSRSRSLSKDQAERKKLVSATKVDWQQAARTAEKEVSGSRLVEIELSDNGKGAPEWDAEVAAKDGTGQDVKVDAVTGKVTRSEKDSDESADDKKKTVDRLAQATVTPAQAVDAATEHQKGTVTGVKLDEEEAGPTVWAVDIVTRGTWAKTTLDVDAGHGKVLHEKVERD
jgi:uncharacterized membrane protein YkoI